MLVFRLTVVFAVACLLRESQSAAYGSYGYGAVVVPGSTTSDYFSVVQSTGLVTIIRALSTALTTAQTSVNSIPTTWSTYRMSRDAAIMIRFSTETISLVSDLANALSSMASDSTIPIEELSEQFERTYKKLQKYAKKDYKKYIDEIKEHFGCPLSHQFNRVWRDVNHEINHLARIIEQLQHAVVDSQTKHGLITESGTMSDMVGALASSIQKLTTAVATLSSTVTSSITGLKSANTFAGQIFTLHNTTFMALNTTRVAVKTAVATQLSNVLTKYYGLQTSIKSDISTTLAKLSIFSNSEKLKSLTKKFHKVYIEVYNFLRRRNRTDAIEFKKYTHSMKDNTDGIMERAFHMFYDAMRRTIDKAIDVLLQRGASSDSCFATYSVQLTPLYTQMATLSQSCVARETARWAGLVTAESDIIALISSLETELTTNIARCATYTNYVTSSIAHSQAYACMRTSMEDMKDFTYLIEPQIDQIDKLTRKQVTSSKYRLENCYFSRLHELTAFMKSVRISLEYCAGRHESCPRKNRDSDGKDWYDRHRGCEDGDGGLGATLEPVAMGNSTMGNGTMPSPPSGKCKKRKPPLTDLDSDEIHSDEDDNNVFSKEESEEKSDEKSVEELEDFSKEKHDKNQTNSENKGSVESNSKEDSSERETATTTTTTRRTRRTTTRSTTTTTAAPTTNTTTTVAPTTTTTTTTTAAPTTTTTTTAAPTTTTTTRRTRRTTTRTTRRTTTPTTNTTTTAAPTPLTTTPSSPPTTTTTQVPCPLYVYYCQ